jgi:predicted nucleotidyltransferase
MIDLDPRYLALVKQILAKHLPDQTVWVYGSRVKGTAHDGSDLDLVILNKNENSDPASLLALRKTFSESDLPILIDILNWSDIPDSYKKEIRQAHEIIHSTPDASNENG